MQIKSASNIRHRHVVGEVRVATQSTGNWLSASVNFRIINIIYFKYIL